jgi:hypothetical protein
MLVPGLCEDLSSSSKHAKCVAEAMATWQEQAFTRRLLLEDAASLMPSEPSSNPTTAAARNVFATTAVQLRLVRKNAQAGGWEPESTVQRLVASGEALQDLNLQLLDALGFPVHSDLSDATMPVVVSAETNVFGGSSQRGHSPCEPYQGRQLGMGVGAAAVSREAVQ